LATEDFDNIAKYGLSLQKLKIALYIDNPSNIIENQIVKLVKLQQLQQIKMNISCVVTVWERKNNQFELVNK
jgi:hypothetical protein